nr:hypothetical protein [Tanacetum cinerariifolium]
MKIDKILYDKDYNDMQQMVERLQDQLRDLKGKSSDSLSASKTLDLLNQKLESKIIELEFQVVIYEREISHLKTTYCKIHVKYRSFHSIRAESPYDTKWAKMAQGETLTKSHTKPEEPDLNHTKHSSDDGHVLTGGIGDEDSYSLDACNRVTKSTKDSKKGKIRLLIMHQLIWDFVMTSVNEGLESDELIKSSVENLVLSPSESEDECECDVPACDGFTTFFNLLFDADDDFSSSDNESFFDKDILKEIYSKPLFYEEIIFIKIDPHHLNVESDLIESPLNQDYLIISSSKIDSLLDEFAGKLILLKSFPPGINEADCDPEEEICLIEKLLYGNSAPRPPEEFIFENSDVAIESFSPSHIPVEDSDFLRDEIDLTLNLDDSMPPGIEDGDYYSEGDILEELLSNDSFSLLKNELFHFDIPSSPRPPVKPPDDDKIEPNSGILTIKVVGDISKHYVPIP